MVFDLSSAAGGISGQGMGRDSLIATSPQQIGKDELKARLAANAEDHRWQHERKEFEKRWDEMDRKERDEYRW